MATKKGTKASRKFAASGQLTKKIQARRKHQHIQRKSLKNKNAKGKSRERVQVDSGDGEGGAAKETKSLKKRYITLISQWMVPLIHPFWRIASKACQ
jgi:nucleolar complex protein 2